MADLKSRTGDETAKETTTLSVGDEIQADNARWSFDGDVAAHSEQHIERSVPNYRQGHEIVATLSDFFLYDGAVAHELGCFSGALTRRMAEWNRDKNVRIVGLELEAPMAEAAKVNCENCTPSRSARRPFSAYTSNLPI